MKTKKHGFSIIEVVLVLGIAALIFMMIFLALPSLLASQRDADRKATVMGFVTSLKTYQTNNSRGALPVLSGNGPEIFSFTEARSSSGAGNWRAFIRDYVDPNFVDPTGTEVKFYIANCLNSGGGNLSISAPCAYSSDFANINTSSSVESGLNYTLYVAVGAVCDGDHAVKSGSTRDVAAVYVLERAGRYCYSTNN